MRADLLERRSGKDRASQAGRGAIGARALRTGKSGFGVDVRVPLGSVDRVEQQYAVDGHLIMRGGFDVVLAQSFAFQASLREGPVIGAGVALVATGNDGTPDDGLRGGDDDSAGFRLPPGVEQGRGDGTCQIALC